MYGQDDEAYRGLREMFDIDPQRSELPARLYALLLANPDLDPVRTPCDWLLRGVRSEGPWGPCRVIYRREIEDHPEEVLGDRFANLVNEGNPPKNLSEFLAWRWEALQRLAAFKAGSSRGSSGAGQIQANAWARWDGTRGAQRWTSSNSLSDGPSTPGEAANRRGFSERRNSCGLD